MTWATMDELFRAYGLAVSLGLLLGGVVVLFNSWRG